MCESTSRHSILRIFSSSIKNQRNPSCFTYVQHFSSLTGKLCMNVFGSDLHFPISPASIHYRLYLSFGPQRPHSLLSSCWTSWDMCCRIWSVRGRLCMSVWRMDPDVQRSHGIGALCSSRFSAWWVTYRIAWLSSCIGSFPPAWTGILKRKFN